MKKELLGVQKEIHAVSSAMIDFRDDIQRDRATSEDTRGVLDDEMTTLRSRLRAAELNESAMNQKLTELAASRDQAEQDCKHASECRDILNHGLQEVQVCVLFTSLLCIDL